jgi:catechol 2,3-dioxygenase-like lactoylglutathione lyase family enzyme
MKRSAALVAALIAALSLTPIVHRAHAQAAAPLAGARLTHVAVAVRDIQASLRTFTDILGIDPPPTRAVLLDAAGGGKVGWTVAFLNMPNFFLELDEPAVDAPSPTRVFLDKYGQGIQHIGFGVDGPVSSVVEGLQKKGGVLTIGTPGGRVAFVDLTSVIGTTVEIVQGGASPSPTPAPTDPQRLAANPVNHVGLVYRNAQPAIKGFAALLGVTEPALAAVKPIDYLPAAHAKRGAHMRSAQITAGSVAVEFIEPVGAPSPWADHLSAHGGNPPHHLAFRYADQAAFDAAVRRLQQKSGVWVNGKRGVEGARKGSSPAFAFDTFGLTIELISS